MQQSKMSRYHYPVLVLRKYNHRSKCGQPDLRLSVFINFLGGEAKKDWQNLAAKATLAYKSLGPLERNTSGRGPGVLSLFT